MSLSLADLKSLLLELLFLRDVAAISDVGKLGDADWLEVKKMLAEHRLGPLFHWRLTHECSFLPVPPSIREYCEGSFRAATIRSLGIQRELLKLHRILESSGIRHVGLKGARLAFFCYPQPGLRPMRDLDILVPEADVLKAFDALIDGGCSRIDKYDGSAEAWTKHSHHMPPLRSPSRMIGVELHRSLFHLKENGAEGFELSELEGFWERHAALSLAGKKIPYLSPAEQLLHLIVHAVYDHQFNNGPLLISDIGYLLQCEQVDWEAFWRLAKQGGHEKGATLALRMVERYWGKQAIDWGIEPIAVEEDLLESACRLMLCDFEASNGVRVAHAFGLREDFRGKMAYLVSKAFPRRSQIALVFPVSEKSPWVYAWYPVKWWWLMTHRLPGFLRARKQVRLKAEMSGLGKLNDWLNRIE